MNNQKYWEERQALNYVDGEKEIISFYKDLEKAFIQAKREIQTVLNDFYIRYADNNGLSYSMAQEELSKSEIGELNNFIQKAYATMGNRDQDVINKSIKARITRYQALEKQLEAILDNLYNIQYKENGGNKLKDVYMNSYNRTWYNIDVYNGFHSEFAQVDVRTMEELIKYPFNGANYSDRLWKQKDHMISKLKENITTMIIQGKNPKTLSREFSKIFDTKEYEAYRLLHTEGSFIIEQGTLAAYKEDGVKEYQILATLDLKTSEICREQDNKIYEIDKAITGTNYPPFHYFCRTTTVPHYGDEEVGKRVARGEEGKTYEVPSNMSYTQWYDRYITKETEKEYNSLIGLYTSNNIKITGVSDHIVDRAIERKVSGKDAKDALLNPLKLGKIKKKDNGNSQELVGENARVIINPDTGNIITVWRTSSKLRNKLKGAK